MQTRRLFAITGGTIALSLTLAASSLAAGTAVSVRVEGLSRTLLPATTVHTHGGSIIKGATPAGACPAVSAAGALDVATHHRWGGSYSSGLGIDINQILGQTLSYSHGYYWSIWVDDRYASAGICGLKLHRGEQLLFAPYPAKGSVYPILITAPRHAKINQSFKVKVYYENAKGISKPLAGVLLKDAAAVTGRNGVATITARRAGRLTLTAGKSGYIRSASATVGVSS
jgi:hypothetical protein